MYKSTTRNRDTEETEGGIDCDLTRPRASLGSERWQWRFSSKTSGKGCRKRKHGLRGRKKREGYVDDFEISTVEVESKAWEATKGEDGETVQIELLMRVVADIGLVGSSKCRKIVNLKSYNESIARDC